ncbi:MAG: hypothetical protein RL234_1584, partial [Pseudomonadota bacterium]
AGHPMIAKWLFNYIFGETSAPADLEIDMAHHYIGQETPKVKVTECIEFFVEQVEDIKDLKFNRKNKIAQGVTSAILQLNVFCGESIDLRYPEKP